MGNMMSRLVAAIAFVTFIGAAGSTQACDKPKPVAIPNGLTATEAEMISADQAIKLYMADVNAYTECLESDTQSLRAGASRSSLVSAQSRENQLIAKHNAAVENMERVAEKFNEAVADYKSRN